MAAVGKAIKPGILQIDLKHLLHRGSACIRKRLCLQQYWTKRRLFSWNRWTWSEGFKADLTDTNRYCIERQQCQNQHDVRNKVSSSILYIRVIAFICVFHFLVSANMFICTNSDIWHFLMRSFNLSAIFHRILCIRVRTLFCTGT